MITIRNLQILKKENKLSLTCYQKRCLYIINGFFTFILICSHTNQYKANLYANPKPNSENRISIWRINCFIKIEQNKNVNRNIRAEPLPVTTTD